MNKISNEIEYISVVYFKRKRKKATLFIKQIKR